MNFDGHNVLSWPFCFSFPLERKYALPVVLHVDNGHFQSSPDNRTSSIFVGMFQICRKRFSLAARCRKVHAGSFFILMYIG